MKCDCQNNTNNVEEKIRLVQGNVLRLSIPLTLRILEKVGDEIQATDEDFIPSSDYPVVVELSKGRTIFAFDATMRNGNLACMEDMGTIPVGSYAIEVRCKDNFGRPYRFKQKAVLHVYDATADAGINTPVEYEVATWYLDAAVFLTMKGDDGVGIEDIITNESQESGGYNTVTFILTNGTSRSFRVRNGVADAAMLSRFEAIESTLNTLFAGVVYNNNTKRISFYGRNNTVLATLDASPFVNDNILTNVYIRDNQLIVVTSQRTFSVDLPSGLDESQYARVNADARIDYINIPAMVLDSVYVDTGIIPRPFVPSQHIEEWWYLQDGKIHHPAYDTSHQGMPTIVDVEYEPSMNVLYFCRANDKFYLFNGIEMVEKSIGSGGGGAQVQSDWEESDTNSPAYIKHKPTIPTAINGKSAYQIALDNGFEGSEADWLASLHGQDGQDGGGVESVSVNGGQPVQPVNGNVNLQGVATEDYVDDAVDDKLTQVVVNEISGAADIITIDDADLALIDEDGNIAMRVADGHVETQNFDSRQVTTNTTAIQQLQSQIGQAVSNAQNVLVKEDSEAAFDIADENGKVAFRITSQGHIKTKGFDSENMDIFRATKLDSPQCICHGYGSVSGQANTIPYFRAGYVAGYRFFECDAINCTDGIPVCTHQYDTITVYDKVTHEETSVSMQKVNNVWTIQMDSDELVGGYTWDAAGNIPIALLSEVIWQVCYFYRCPLHIDGQGLNEASRYAASQYAETLGVGQYVFHELQSGAYTDWAIPCNAIVSASSAADIQTKAASYKKADNNIIFYLASGATVETIKSLADAAHEVGCYLMSWTFATAAAAREWFANGADFIITSNSITNDKI